MNQIDAAHLTRAYELARKSYEEGGCPIGSVLARGEDVLGEGHNQRVQRGDPIAHGEMDALRNAGRQRSYAGTTLYTSLSPCMMCAGTIVQFKVPRVVIAENTTFGGNEDFLRARGRDRDRARCAMRRIDAPLHRRAARTLERGYRRGVSAYSPLRLRRT